MPTARSRLRSARLKQSSYDLHCHDSLDGPSTSCALTFSNSLLENRRDQLEYLSAWADPTTWQVVKTVQDKQTGKDISFFAPQWTEKILARQQKEQSEAVALNHTWTLKHWGRKLRETGEVGSAFTLEEVIEQIEKRNKLTRTAPEVEVTIELST